jgi:hypothetical protein
MGVQDDDAVPPAAAKGSGAESTPVSIPKPRFDEVNERLKASQAANADLQAQLAALRAVKPAQTEDTEKKPAAKPATEPQGSGGLADEMRVLRLRVDHGVSEEAARLVLGYEQKGLNAQDALDFARTRQPKLFGEDKRGFDPSTHSSSAPGSGPPPSTEKPPEPSELDKVRGIRNPELRGKAAMKGAVSLVKAQMFPGQK